MARPGHLPRGVTLVEGQLQIDTGQLDENGIMELLRGGFISADDVGGLRRQIEVANAGRGAAGSIGAQGSLGFDLGGGILDAIGGLFGGATNAIGGLFGGNDNIITLENRNRTAPRVSAPPQFGPTPPPGGTSRTPPQVALPPGAPTAQSTGDPTADAALAAGDTGAANTILGERGFRIEEVQRRSVNPLTGELFDTVDQFLVPTTTTPGGVQDVFDGQSSFLGNPLLDQAQFQFEQQLRQDELDRQDAALIDVQGAGDRTAENVAITELLLDPRTRNLLKILQAKDRGDKFVQGLNLPPEVINLFGGSSPELGLRTLGAGFEPNLTPEQRALAGIDIAGQPLEGNARGIQTVIDQFNRLDFTGQSGDVNRTLGPNAQQPLSVQKSIPGSPDAGFGAGTQAPQGGGGGGFLQKLFSALNGFGGAEGFGPALQGQLSPGTVRGFTDDELGALQAAFINSGTTLGEQQRLSRRSALPGGR